jgi:hypothetical protein
MDDYQGILYIWSIAVSLKPEFKFYSQSPILRARFHDTNEHIIIGSCYTGQILQWDLRHKSLPSQRSSLTGKGHKHPVYSLDFVSATSSSLPSSDPTGTSSSELITVSVDGLMCHWDLTRLSEPINVINLQNMHPQNSIIHPSQDLSSSDYSYPQGTGYSASVLPLNITSMLLDSHIMDNQLSREILFGKILNDCNSSRFLHFYNGYRKWDWSAVSWNYASSSWPVSISGHYLFEMSLLNEMLFIIYVEFAD